MENGNDYKKLADKIKDIRIAMLTTMDEDGDLRSRPMATNEIDEDGALWFFTEANSTKIFEINQEAKVNISYADKDNELYVSVSGVAKLVKDQNKIDELWSSFLKVWFPNGKDDPNIAMIQVQIDKAEYWDAPGNRMVQLVGMAKAALTGEAYRPGENEKLNFN